MSSTLKTSKEKAGPRFRITHLESTHSTNTLARECAENGVPEGLVLWADYQTHGRGKPGRQWISPAGKDLLFSVILRPPIAPNEAPILTQIACRSVAAVLKKTYGIHATIKKPNDVMAGGKKICGVLTEAVSKDKQLESVIIGIGLNVNSTAAELLPGATSVKILNGKNGDRKALFKSLLNHLKKDIQGLYAHST